MSKKIYKIILLLCGLSVLAALIWRLKKTNLAGFFNYLKSHLLISFLILVGFMILVFLSRLIFKSSKKKIWFGLILLIILSGFTSYIDLPKPKSWNFSKIGIDYTKEVKFYLGLDIKGGSHLVYEADLSKISADQKSNAISSVIEVIDKRINAFGVTEPIIQSSEVGGKSRIIVELPGIQDVKDAISLIGKTAQLDFKEQKDNTLVPTGLTGAHLKGASTQTDPQTGKIEVAIEFNEEGKKLFAEITKKNLNKIVAIYLDNEIISAPTVQAVIEDGKAVITGDFDLKQARQLAIELNAGALPVPINLVEQRNIGPTLGQASIKKSLVGGIIGLLMVILFMLIYYRLLGILGSFSLITYGIFTLALFKLIPVTLTLAGIAGFVLSMGMALEANILVFERIREELKEGKSFISAYESGFRKAWSSIWDSNVVSFIICIILYWFGAGMVVGFALTLGIGIIISLLVVVLVTKLFLKILALLPFSKNPKLFRVDKIYCDSPAGGEQQGSCRRRGSYGEENV